MKTFFAILLLMIGTMAVHYLLVDRRAPREAIVSVVKLTGISQPSLSVAWYAPRMLAVTEHAANPAYPELDPIQRSDFVYAQ